MPAPYNDRRSPSGSEKSNDADPNRAHLGRRVVCDLLVLCNDVYESVRRLSAKWCAEPSVRGGKARPKGAGLVI